MGAFMRQNGAEMQVLSRGRTDGAALAAEPKAVRYAGTAAMRDLLPQAAGRALICPGFRHMSKHGRRAPKDQRKARRG
jgi:hypothetical protein